MVELVALGGWLDLVILRVFFNLNGSVIPLPASPTCLTFFLGGFSCLSQHEKESKYLILLLSCINPLKQEVMLSV